MVLKLGSRACPPFSSCWSPKRWSAQRRLHQGCGLREFPPLQGTRTPEMACLHGCHQRSSLRSSRCQSRLHGCALVLVWRVGSRQYCDRGRSLNPLPKRDVALFLELVLDLAMQRLLIGFHHQKEVAPLLQSTRSCTSCLQRWLGCRNQPGPLPVVLLPCKATQLTGREDSLCRLH
jgi:hypothetical protein